MDLPRLPLLLVPDTLASAPLRGALLMVFIIALFGAAFAAVKIGQRKRASQAASDLSALTGTGDGAHRGGDGSVSSEWWNSAINDDEHMAPTQTWQSAFLDDPAPHAAASGPAYGKTLDLPALAVEVAPVPLEPVYAVPVHEAPEPHDVTGGHDDATATPEAPQPPEDIVWSDTDTEVEVAAWSTPLVDLAAFDEPVAEPDEALADDDEPVAEPAPVAPGASEPVRTDITYVPDLQAPPAQYAHSAPAVAQVAAAAIYEEPAPVTAPVAPVEEALVEAAPVPVEPEPVFDAPEPVFDAPVFVPAPVEPVVFGAPISLSPAAPASADNSWGADETGGDEGISPTWWQQAIADDK